MSTIHEQAQQLDQISQQVPQAATDQLAAALDETYTDCLNVLGDTEGLKEIGGAVEEAKRQLQEVKGVVARVAESIAEKARHHQAG